MYGVILAVAFVLLALVFGLIAVYVREKLPTAQVARPGREEDFVTRHELEVAIEKNSQDFEFMTNEWYEKFNALHQRLAKREKRAADPTTAPQLELVGRPAVPPSVRAHYQGK